MQFSLPDMWPNDTANPPRLSSKRGHFSLWFFLAMLAPVSVLHSTSHLPAVGTGKCSQRKPHLAPISQFLFAIPLQEKLRQQQVLLLSYIYKCMVTLACRGTGCRQTRCFVCVTCSGCVGDCQGVAVRDASRALAQPLAMIVAQPASCRAERFSPNRDQPKKTTARGSK